jgi:hypothetical protein
MYFRQVKYSGKYFQKSKTNMHLGNFQLNKWFLDFVGEDGIAMIFYAAKLRWRDWVVPYTSWLNYDPTAGVSQISRYRNVQMPKKKDSLITWSDSKFGVEGTWEMLAKPLQARLFDSKEGWLDWKCFQPASKVRLRINNVTIEGRGYAEQLVLTAPPWNIPMDELRWGRYGSSENQMVWIELREEDKKQWLWLNGEKMEICIIEDDHISIPEKDVILKLDKGVILESEKKISVVAEKLLHHIPGVNKVMPLKFLMADEFKWLSKGQLQANGNTISTGMAIHEFVNFKSQYP